MKVAGERPSKTGPARCRACGLEIVWAITDRGKRMPVDRTPALPGVGNLVLFFDVDLFGHPIDDVQRVTAATPETKGGTTWVSHFATCPEAARFRKETP